VSATSVGVDGLWAGLPHRAHGPGASPAVHAAPMGPLSVSGAHFPIWRRARETASAGQAEPLFQAPGWLQPWWSCWDLGTVIGLLAGLGLRVGGLKAWQSNAGGGESALGQGIERGRSEAPNRQGEACGLTLSEAGLAAAQGGALRPMRTR